MYYDPLHETLNAIKASFECIRFVRFDGDAPDINVGQAWYNYNIEIHRIEHIQKAWIMMRPDFIDLIKDDMFKEELKPMIKWLDYNLYLYESDIEDSDDE